MHEFSLYLDQHWYSLKAKEGTYDNTDPIGVLDVDISSRLILDEILNIGDLRSSKRIDFVGGLRGLGELKRRVDSGEMRAALALYPVTMQQIMDIADSGKIMPPKATWFEPKLRSGLVIHKLVNSNSRNLGMTDEYKTIATTSEGYYTEKRSKFLAFAHHVETVDEVKELLAGYRKKYYDARHVCYAYMLGAGREEFRANDDGEPSSTAGKPILGQINSNELTDILIVVVRYYGGVNLGTSGLIVAYREAAADAIAHATVETRQVEEVVTYTFAYPQMNDVMRIVKEMSPRILSQSFDNSCEIRLSIRKSEAEQLRNRLSKLL